MLRFFRINDPYRLLGVLIIMLLICLPYFLNTPTITYPELRSILIGEKVYEGASLYIELIDSTAPLTSWLNGLVDLFFGRSLQARHILTFLILFIQSAYLGMLYINKKVFTENSYLPSLCFSVLYLFSFDSLTLHGEVFALGVMLLALNSLFREIEFREQREGSSLSIGLYIGIASLFAFSYAVFLIGAFFILVVYSRNSARKYILLTFGFILPHALLMSIFYLKGGISDLWTNFYLPNLEWGSYNYISASALFVLGAIPIVFLIISFFILSREARFSKYQSQLVQVMFFWMLFAILQIFYSKEFRPQSFNSLIPSLSFYIAHLLLMIRRKRIAELSFWVFILGVVGLNLLSYNNKIDSVDYSALRVPDNFTIKNKIVNSKVLVLSENLAIYQSNALATGFLEWKLAQDIFSRPGFYENLIQVDQQLKKDPPQFIIDPAQLMKPFFNRIPLLRKQYNTKDGVTYSRVKN